MKKTRGRDDVLQAVRQLAEEQRAADEAAFEDLAQATAEGREVSPEKVLAVCDRLGRDYTLFDARARAIEQATADKAIVAREPELKPLHVQVRDLEESAESDLKAAKALYDERQNEIRQTWRRITTLKGEIDQAKIRLRNAAPPELTAQLALAKRLHAAAHERMRSIQAQIPETMRQADAARAHLENVRSTSVSAAERETATAAADKLAEQLERLQAELVEAQASVEQTGADMASIDAERFA